MTIEERLEKMGKKVRRSNMLLMSFRWGFCTIIFLVPGCISIHTSYRQKFTVTQGIKEIQVSIDEVRLTSPGTIFFDVYPFYEVTVINDSNSPVRLLWDDSTYVGPEGQASRLIRGQTRKIHSGLAQPASVVPTHAMLRETFIPEAYTDLFVGIKPDPNRNARINLVFEVEGQKKMCEIQVRFVAP